MARLRYADILRAANADNDVKVEGDAALQVKKMLDMLEDLDDVQDVFHNADLGAAAYA